MGSWSPGGPEFLTVKLTGRRAHPVLFKGHRKKRLFFPFFFPQN